jgi:hypothetical protein
MLVDRSGIFASFANANANFGFSGALLSLNVSDSDLSSVVPAAHENQIGFFIQEERIDDIFGTLSPGSGDRCQAVGSGSKRQTQEALFFSAHEFANHQTAALHAASET